MALITFAALAACAEAEQVTEVPEGEVDVSLASPSGAPEEADANQAAIASNDADAAPGQWFTRTRADGPWAGYGPPNSEAAFAVRCRGEQLVFSTTEMPPTGPGQTEMLLSAPGFEQIVGAEASADGLPTTAASVPADAEWLPRLLAASGNLSVTVGGGDSLVVPISEPLTSLIRDCRR